MLQEPTSRQAHKTKGSDHLILIDFSIFTSDSAASVVLESRALLDVQEWSGDSRECR